MTALQMLDGCSQGSRDHLFLCTWLCDALPASCSWLLWPRDSALDVSITVDSATNTSDGKPVVPPGGNATVTVKVLHMGQAVDNAEVTVLAGAWAAALTWHLNIRIGCCATCYVTWCFGQREHIVVVCACCRSGQGCFGFAAISAPRPAGRHGSGPSCSSELF
eukprot:365546-Chlamydomonas_euryale.AAC.1